MSEETLAICLSLFKLDLGITHNLRDEIFINRIKDAELELKSKPIDLSKETAQDTQLIVDYAVWNYRKRQEDIGLPRNLKFRINNRVIQKAGASDA